MKRLIVITPKHCTNRAYCSGAFLPSLNGLSVRVTLRSLLVGLLTFCCTSPASLWAQEADAENQRIISLAEYQPLLAKAEELLAQASEGNWEAYEEARALLAAVDGVRLSEEEIVYTAPLLGNLEGVDTADLPTSVAAALARVRLVRSQLEAAESDNSTARLALLQQVLARPEFSQPESLLLRIQRWLAELWARLFPESGGQAAMGGLRVGEILFWAIVVIASVALTWMLSFWLQGLFSRVAGDVNTQRRPIAGSNDPITAQEARAEATRLAQDGSYRQAVRQLYLSALLALDEQGVVRYDRALTNREVLSQLHNKEEVKSHMQPVVDTFDRVWYGEQEPDNETFVHYEKEIDELAAAGKREKEG